MTICFAEIVAKKKGGNNDIWRVSVTVAHGTLTPGVEVRVLYPLPRWVLIAGHDSSDSVHNSPNTVE